MMFNLFFCSVFLIFYVYQTRKYIIVTILIEFLGKYDKKA